MSSSETNKSSNAVLLPVVDRIDKVRAKFKSLESLSKNDNVISLDQKRFNDSRKAVRCSEQQNKIHESLGKQVLHHHGVVPVGTETEKKAFMNVIGEACSKTQLNHRSRNWKSRCRSDLKMQPHMIEINCSQSVLKYRAESTSTSPIRFSSIQRSFKRTCIATGADLDLISFISYDRYEYRGTTRLGNRIQVDRSLILSIIEPLKNNPQFCSDLEYSANLWLERRLDVRTPSPPPIKVDPTQNTGLFEPGAVAFKTHIDQSCISRLIDVGVKIDPVLLSSETSWTFSSKHGLYSPLHGLISNKMKEIMFPADEYMNVDLTASYISLLTVNFPELIHLKQWFLSPNKTSLEKDMITRFICSKSSRYENIDSISVMLIAEADRQNRPYDEFIEQTTSSLDPIRLEIIQWRSKQDDHIRVIQELQSRTMIDFRNTVTAAGFEYSYHDTDGATIRHCGRAHELLHVVSEWSDRTSLLMRQKPYIKIKSAA